MGGNMHPLTSLDKWIHTAQMGGMEHDVTVSFRLGADLHAEVERVARAEQRSVSNMLRVIVTEWAAARTEPPPEKAP